AEAEFPPPPAAPAAPPAPPAAPTPPVPPAVPPTTPTPGQTPPAAPPTAPTPGETPPAVPPTTLTPGQTPPSVPPTTTPEEPPPPPHLPRKPLEGPILLNFKDASLRTVLEYLSEAAGLVVVADAALDSRVTVMSRQTLSVDEAVSVLNTVLKEKGYAAIRSGRTLKIVTLDQAKKAALPVRSGSDPDEIEPSDQLVTHIIPLQYVDAAQVKRDLATLVPTYADLSSNASSNTLILTDTQTNVRRFVEIIRALDARMAGVSEVKVFQLKYANAANAARLITDLFKPDQTAQGGGNPFAAMRRAFMGPGGPGGPGGRGGSSSDDSGQGGRQQKITASADDRTNTLVVSGPPDTLRVIEGVVKELDANPTEEQAVFFYPLKNATAVNIEGVLNSIFGWSGTTTGRATTQRQSLSMPGRTGSNTGSRGIGGSSSGRSGAGGMGSSGMGSGGFASGGMGSSGAGASRFGSGGTFGGGMGAGMQGRGSSRISPTTASAASDLAGQVYVVADADTNSLLVTAATKNFDKIKEILADLDRPVPQVLIKVLIAEVTHDNSLDLGAEFSILNMNAAGTKGEKYGTDFSVAAQTGGLVVKLLHDDYTATLRALATTGKLDVLSRPYILTSDNQEAWIQVGQYVPFVAYTQLTDTGITNNSYQWQDIGIILTVMPHINPDGLVIMDVYQEISDLTSTTVPLSGTTTARALAKRAAQSRVAVRDSQTIVIGGLMADRSTDTVSKVPLLGDIPGLGALFRRTVTTKTKTELLIFLTPHVATVPDDLKTMAEDEQAGAKVIREAVEPGAFDEHMKGMQRGAVVRPPGEKERQSPGAKIDAPPPAKKEPESPPAKTEINPPPGRSAP
ncbi:MAG: type II secretion system secretin GspD, partial [Planctomycetota bacterium]|nr:type II secretion system secretin GspD [Planctomycetota bacterium]